jgi:polar amino acid transport system substrate-binding protein
MNKELKAGTTNLSAEVKVLLILTLLVGVIFIALGLHNLFLDSDNTMLCAAFSLGLLLFVLAFYLVFKLVSEYKKSVRKYEAIKQELQNINQKMEVISETDELTGVGNRRHVMSLLRRLVLLHEVEFFSAIMIDIDYFKAINDTHGHSVGDLVLKDLAQMLTENIRETDTVGRVSGEEFLIILPETKQKEAEQKAEELIEKVEYMGWKHPNLRVTISAGVYCKESDESLDSVLEKVDHALYAAKRRG